MPESCPECGSYGVRPTMPPDDRGDCEFRCEDCGEYFVGTNPDHEAADRDGDDAEDRYGQ